MVKLIQRFSGDLIYHVVVSVKTPEDLHKKYHSPHRITIPTIMVSRFIKSFP